MKRIKLPDGNEVFHLRRFQTFNLYKEIFLDKAYFPPEFQIGKGSIIFDVGANIGMASLFFSQNFDAEVYSFEPVPEAHEVLRANCDKFSIKGKVFPVAISDHDGPAEITYYPRRPGRSGFYFDPASEAAQVRAELEEDLDQFDTERITESLSRYETRECTCWTLSRAITETDVAQVDLLKIDVEGSELDVLSGIVEDDWGKIRQVVAEIHDVGTRIESALTILTDHDFSASLVEAGLPGRRDGYIIASRNPDS